MAEIRYVEVDGVRLRTSIRGAVRPLLLTGIGASLGLSAPFEDALHPHSVQKIAVDAPRHRGLDPVPQEIIHGGGHLFPLERPAEIAALVAGFLAAIGTALAGKTATLRDQTWLPPSH